MMRIENAVIAVAAQDVPVVAAAIGQARPDLTILLPDDAVPYLERTALVAFKPPEAPGRYEGVPWVHCAGAGADRLIHGLGFRPALMTRTVGRMGEQIGEYVATYLLMDLQRVSVRQEREREARWDKEACVPRQAFDQRALVLGTGGIGSGIARTLCALGMAVDGVSRSGAPADRFGRVFTRTSLPDDLSGYDVIVCALPATSGTEGFVNHDLLRRLGGALLISVGRGAAVAVGAVEQALASGCLRRAVLDVFSEEPLPTSSPLWQHPGVTVTPHVSGITRPADIVDSFLEALGALERDEAPPLIVDQDTGY